MAYINPYFSDKADKGAQPQGHRNLKKSPSERVVKAILDFSKAYRVQQHQVMGHVSYLLN